MPSFRDIHIQYRGLSACSEGEFNGISACSKYREEDIGETQDGAEEEGGNKLECETTKKGKTGTKWGPVVAKKKSLRTSQDKRTVQEKAEQMKKARNLQENCPPKYGTRSGKESVALKAKAEEHINLLMVFREKLYVCLDKLDETDSVVSGANFLLQNIPGAAFTHMNGQRNPVDVSPTNLSPYLVKIGSGCYSYDCMLLSTV